MGSSADSRYWICPWCFRQFDWEADEKSSRHPDNHDADQCKKNNAAQLQREREFLAGKRKSPN